MSAPVRRSSARLQRKNSAEPYARPEAGGSGSTGLTGYMAKSKIDFDEDDAAPKRSISIFGGGKKKKAADKKEGEKEESMMGRTMSLFKKKPKDGDMTRSETMAKKKKDDKKKGGGAADSSSGGEQKTVFISCSTLIKEVKLCVGADQQASLDSLYEKLSKHEIPAEQAVKQLMEMVGSTIVQQAGLSVMNAQKGVLPHGWLEYADEASGRPYYYNVHTKVTTWYKPSGAVPPPPPPPAEEEAAAGAGMVNLDCNIDTHNVAMTGFI